MDIIYMDTLTTEFERSYSTIAVGINTLVMNNFETLKEELKKYKKTIEDLTKANNELLKENDSLQTQLNQKTKN